MTETAKPTSPIWCPGCGDFGVMAAIKRALTELKVPAEETVLVGGIGCSGAIHNFMEGYGFHSLHGRLLPTAVGVKLANPKLTVLAIGGDGDGYAIGMGHFVHALKKNAALTYVVMNNETYGLTKGQASPTAPVGFSGNVETPFDATLLAMSIPSSGFVARGFSGAPREAGQLITQAIQFNRERRGFAFVEILSPCVTYNDTYKEWREQVQNVDTVPGYDRTDRTKAIAGCLSTIAAGRIPVGLLFRPSDDRLAPSLDRTLIPTVESAPATAEISLEANRARYEKLLSGLA